MKKFIFLFSVLFLFVSINAQSQVFRIGDYGFTNTTSPYAALTGDSTVAVLPSFDSGITTAILIGFPFRFGTRIFDSLKVNSNGWMTFNSPTTATTTTTPISTAATIHIIAPFARDLDSTAGARVSIQRSGVAPNRIFKIQWLHFKSFASTIVPADANFQVWLYEGSNVVELRYGNVLAGTRTGTSTVQVGLKGGSTATDSLRTVQGATWPTATVSNTTTSKTIGPTDLPDSNRVYRFTPFQQQANDVAVTALLSPAGVLSNCPIFCIAPKATFRNVGQLFAAYSATFQITGPGAPYTSTRSDTLSVGLSRTLTFDSTFCPSVTGTYNFRAFITFGSDTNRANDTLAGTVTVVNPGAGGGLPANCNYFWANNLACSPAPSKPTFGRFDTTGSTYLIIDSTVQPPGSAYGVTFIGSRDDGYWKAEIPGPDPFRICGVTYDSFFVGTNGQISFTLAGGNTTKMDDFTTQNIPSILAVQPGVFPFWKDFNFNTSPALTGARISYKITPSVDGPGLLITYDHVPNFGATLSTDYTTFQVYLQLLPGPVQDGLIIVNYDDSRTGAEFLRKYFNFELAGHTVGIQDVTGTLGIQYRRVTGTGMANVTVPGPLFASPVAVAFGPNQQVLPVELASFTSTVERRDVTLNWTTARESNNSGFEIERSAVNGEWSKVGFVNGSGTTTSMVDYSYNDRGLTSGKYNYRLKQMDFNGNFEYFNLGSEVNVGIPTKYDLSQNYPNPFNPTTKINYDLPYDAKVSIKLFDMSGREVATLVNNVQPAGYYTATFNGANLSSGTYFYRISADANGQNFVATKKMVLIK